MLPLPSMITCLHLQAAACPIGAAVCCVVLGATLPTGGCLQSKAHGCSMSVSFAAAAGRSDVRRRIALLLLTAAGAALLSQTVHRPPPPQPLQQPAEHCHTKALLPLKHRQLFGQLLEREGATVGAELGVQVSTPGGALVARAGWLPCTCSTDALLPTHLLRCRRRAGLPT